VKESLRVQFFLEAWGGNLFGYGALLATSEIITDHLLRAQLQPPCYENPPIQFQVSLKHFDIGSLAVGFLLVYTS